MRVNRRDFVKIGAAALASTQATQGSVAEPGEPPAGTASSVESLRSSTQVPKVSDWEAKWIWSNDDGLGVNRFVYFRRNFSLASAPTEPINIGISADNEYILFVNDQKVGFGPPNSDPRRRYFDVHNIQPYLSQGRNVIAARVYSLATATEDTKKERGRFILQGGIEKIRFDTDNKWKFMVSDVWEQNAPRYSFELHYAEIADLRKEPVGWKEVGFDDSRWLEAYEIGGPSEGPGQMVQRELGAIHEIYRPAASVMRVAEVRRAHGFAIPALQVNAEPLLAIRTVEFSNLQSFGENSPQVSVKTPVNGKDAVIVLDMGEMVLGCPFFEVQAGAGTVIDVSISEYLQDGRVLASRKIEPTQSTNLTDRITLRQGMNQWQRNDYDGYRYIQLTIRDATETLILHRVGTVLRNYDFQQEAIFRSSDSTLDRIFDGCKLTHRVNTHWGYCGSGWREHAQWSDLSWPAMNLAIFQNAPVMRYYLQQTALGQNAEGRMQFPYPGHIGTELPEQTMWLADDLWKCALYSNDLELLRDILPVMVKANEWFNKHLTSRGLITTKNWTKIWLVIDWGYPYVNNSEPGELATLNLIYYQFLRSVEMCADTVKDEDIRDRFRAQANSLKATINKTFLAPEQDFYFEKPDLKAPSQYASTLAVGYGVAPDEHREKIFSFAVDPNLRPGKASPWFMYNVLESFATAERFDDAVASIRRYWSTFLDAGATTYWELWNIPGEDVHPIPGYTKEMAARTITYSTGPAPYIVNHILGVQPLTPGFAETLIAPHYSGLKFADGKAPTPMGYVHVRWERQPSEMKSEIYIAVPDGINATIHSPFADAEPIVSVNGQMFYDGRSFHPNTEIQRPLRAKNYLQFKIKPGLYYFRSSASEQSTRSA